jgi:type I site-specific restriction-modification system R (restriction) subunit
MGSLLSCDDFNVGGEHADGVDRSRAGRGVGESRDWCETAGVIVDYVGVFQNLQKALAIYAAKGSDSTPIKDKDELVVELEKVLAEARVFCTAVGVDIFARRTAQSSSHRAAP